MHPTRVAPLAPAAAVLQASPWQAAEVPPLGRVRSFVKDETIMAAGGCPIFFYKVVSGMVRTCQVLADGRRKIAAFYTAGDVFGIEAGHEHRFAAEALGDVTVLAYRRCSFDRVASGDGRIGRMVMDAMIRDLGRAHDHMLVLARKSAIGRVAAFLLDLSDRAAGRVVDLSMPRADIADYLGLTIESVSRSFTQLERLGVIEVLATRRTVIVRDMAALRGFDA
ncbi:helix-turn-helix domain-containing protein [Geminicoccus roseus]|uniref:helix-turn-helix domain-containing protein n=1 Tax=Geminicoccus roseus TaxID=404900 RepID=UPI00047FBDF2|nr:helix-turn-helix domain-containing protein [Geminicoccus roseus]